MEIIWDIASISLLGIILLFIAFPYKIFAQVKTKEDKVGPSYWGIYPDSPADEPEALKKIVIKKKCKKEHITAGSSQYAQGRGTSFRM